MTVKSIPERLIAFNVYHEGSTNLVGTADVQLPSFEMMTETLKGAGIAGEVETPTIGHFQSLKLSFSWRTTTPDILKTLRQKSQRIEVRGAIQEFDSANSQHKTVPIRVVAQAVPLKLELGKMESGSPMDGSTELEVTYIKVELAGRTMIEIDKLNYVCVIDGVDYLAPVRTALGQ